MVHRGEGVFRKCATTKDSCQERVAAERNAVACLAPPQLPNRLSNPDPNTVESPLSPNGDGLVTACMPSGFVANGGSVGPVPSGVQWRLRTPGLRGAIGGLRDRRSFRERHRGRALSVG
jgi:hypothetical protein